MKTLALVLLFVAGVFGQKSVSDLAPGDAAALERYMSANKDLTFRQDYNLSDEYLKWMRESFGKGFKPSYAVGDFNGDKIRDFAVLLYRDGKSTPNEGISTDEHSVDYPLRLVVFNGTGKGFRVAFTQDLSGPNAAYISFKKKLHYGIFETDSDDFYLAPAGRGYIAEFPKEP